MAQGAALKAKDHFPGLMKIYKYMSETVIRIIPLDWQKKIEYKNRMEKTKFPISKMRKDMYGVEST